MTLGYNNLAKFLREKEVNELSEIRLFENCIEIVTPGCIWPNGFYFFSSQSDTNSIIHGIQNRTDVLFVAENDNITFDFRSLGYMPADIWYSMSLNLGSIDFIKISNELHLKNIVDENEMMLWKKNTELVFFNGNSMSLKTIENFIGSDNFQLLHIVNGLETIGQAMLYFNNDEVGLYFFAIYQVYRNNGYGKLAINQLCSYLQMGGYKKFVLQSTRKAKELYLNAGFSLEEKIYLYKKKVL